LNPTSIQFAVLHDGAPLEWWQQRSIEQLRALPAVANPVSIELANSQAAVQLHRGGLDFILNFSRQPIPAGLLDAARYGVWQFQFGDWPRLRGVPEGFWEVYEGHPTTCARLVRQTARADAVIVAREGHLRTDLLSSKRNRVQLLERCTHWPAQVCIDIRNGVADFLTAAPLVRAEPERSQPTLIQRAIYTARIGARILRTVLQALLCHDQWNVGIVDAPITSFLGSNNRDRVRWLPGLARSQFRADPFGLIRDGRLIVLCEQLDYQNSVGKIVAIDVSNNTVAPVTIGPTPSVHMSYPLLLELEGHTFCVPETCAVAEIGLYQAEHFPDRWRKTALLAPGSGAIVDATLFRHEDRWWLAGSEDAPKGATSELHLWYADEVTGPWTAHPGNPVKIDIRSARPGGTPFHVNGVLFRPAQDCSQVYGARIVINRVELLTPTAFREVPAACVEPDPAGPYPDGLHTLCAVEDMTLIDSKRVVFMAPEFRRVLRHFVTRALRPLGLRR
jgi:hypothetical protein